MVLQLSCRTGDRKQQSTHTTSNMFFCPEHGQTCVDDAHNQMSCQLSNLLRIVLIRTQHEIRILASNHVGGGEQKTHLQYFVSKIDLQKNAVTRKCCLQITICLEDNIFSQVRNNILAIELSCVEGCNTGFNDSQPSSRFPYDQTNRLKIMR